MLLEPLCLDGAKMLHAQLGQSSRALTFGHARKVGLREHKLGAIFYVGRFALDRRLRIRAENLFLALVIKAQALCAGQIRIFWRVELCLLFLQSDARFFEAEPGKPGQVKGVIDFSRGGFAEDGKEYDLYLETVDGPAEGVTVKLSR